MHDNMEQQLSSWRTTLQTELSDLEQQANAIRAAMAEKHAKIDAIDRLLGTETASATVDLAASAADFDDTFAPATAYWQPILSVLIELGGRARRKKVIELVGQKMKGVLTPADYANLDSHGVRWENRVAWQASNMRRVAGLVRNDSPRGVWEITNAGRQWLADHS